MLIKSLEKLEMIRPFHGRSRQADLGLLRSALLVNAMVLAGIIFLLNTYQGIGILPDSTRYMRLSPTPYDAPLYTWLLALTGQVADMETAAKCVGLLLVCLNTLLLWHIIWKGTASIPATALGTAAIIFAPQYVSLHSVAMSEPLFLTALFATVLLFLKYRESGHLSWLIFCAVALALSMLVRFAALPLAATLSVMLLTDRNKPLPTRIRELMLLGGIGAAIFFAWAIVSQLIIGHSVGRELAFNGNTDAQLWRSGLNMLTVQLLPSAAPYPLRLVFLLMLTGAIIVLAVHWVGSKLNDPAGRTDRNVVNIFGLYALFYIGFMLFSVSIEANLNLNGRYALPFYVAATIAATSLACTRSESRSASMARQTVIGAGLLIIVSHVIRTVDLTREDYTQGIGFASRSWKSSPTIRAVNMLPYDAKIYSNGPDALNYLTPRTTAFTPALVQRRTGRDNPVNSFADQVERLRAQLVRGNAYIVILDRVDWRFYLASEAELQRLLNLKMIRREADGRIYTGL
ncbi:glycosyltransferase family 39 protein [Sphingobium sp.]|uniref:glycosyltransferase family 39 protein n=1 Tax=Sphingobium sp. TaxID=1912891 RepID=UPI0035C7386B